jgi:hypothetical protein
MPDKEQQKKRGRQAPDTSDIGRDTSNPFIGDVNMALQNEFANLNNMWRGGPQAPVQVQARSPEQTQFLANMMDLWRTKAANQSPEAIRQNLQSLAEVQDPVGFAQERKEAQLADPFGKGGYFEGRRAADLYSPEAILASQGNTAEMQLRQAGAGKKPKEGEPEFDLDELKRMNQLYAAGRRSYAG